MAFLFFFTRVCRAHIVELVLLLTGEKEVILDHGSGWKNLSNIAYSSRCSKNVILLMRRNTAETCRW